MPSWWRRKSMSRPSSAASSPRKSEEEAESPAAVKDSPPSPSTPVTPRRAAGKAPPSPLVSQVSVPLPLPLPLPLPRLESADSPAAGTGGVTSASASVSHSSVSSSGSSEDAGDVWRCHETTGMLRGRSMGPDGHVRADQKNQHLFSPERHYMSTNAKNFYSSSPVRWFHSSQESPVSSNHSGPSTSDSTQPRGRSASYGISNTRTRSPSPNSRGNMFANSVLYQKEFVFSPTSPSKSIDDVRNTPHPLPLPPGSPSSSPHPFQSRYRKGKPLGSGTFGQVYLGFDSEHGQMCAIKEVKVIQDDPNSKECLRQLNQEIALLSHLSHPNIVRYYGSELTDETLSVYLEYVSGGSLNKILREYGSLKESVIRNYTAQILSGIAYLHARGTVHRDIKGANILVDPNGDVKLADFGMAKHIATHTGIHSFKGSPYWMAPEVIMNNNKGYSLSVDIWSLGCTIIEMATSKPPWHNFEGIAAIFKIANGRDIPEIPDDLSAEGKEFLRLCLKRDPAARPSATKLMDHPFVRDQPAVKAAKLNSHSDVFPLSLNGGTYAVTQRSRSDTTPKGSPSSSKRSVTPLRGIENRSKATGGYYSAMQSPYTNSSYSSNYTSGTRANLSLPVSPCSSPLRQTRQANRSCMPSPPTHLTGTGMHSPVNHGMHPIHQSVPTLGFRYLSPDASPRR